MSLFGPQYYLTEKSLESRIATAISLFYSKYRAIPEAIRFPVQDVEEGPDRFVSGEFVFDGTTFKFRVKVTPDKTVLPSHIWVLFEVNNDRQST